MKVAIVTLFPDMFTAVTDYGITGRACRNGLLDLKCAQLMTSRLAAAPAC